MFFVISKERLVKEVELRGKGQGKGTLNYFVKEINMNAILHVIYTVNGCNYLYTCMANDIPMEIKFYLQQSGEILGIVNGDYLSSEEDNEEDIEVSEIPEVVIDSE